MFLYLNDILISYEHGFYPELQVKNILLKILGIKIKNYDIKIWIWI